MLQLNDQNGDQGEDFSNQGLGRSWQKRPKNKQVGIAIVSRISTSSPAAVFWQHRMTTSVIPTGRK
jgi:hypothetical protein